MPRSRMRLLLRALALASCALGGAGETAGQENGRIVGDWYVTTQTDRFGDGGTYLAAAASAPPGYFLAVRCIRREWSVGIFVVGLDPKPLSSGAIFTFKLRADRRPIIESAGVAVNERLILLDTNSDPVREILHARELAVRMRSADGLQQDVVFALGGAKRALAPHLRECPEVE